MITITIDVNPSWVEEAAEDSDCLPEEILRRMKGLYESNFYEDLKWVIETIEEDRELA